jgi:molybdopterin converting factor small subunit
MATVTVRYWAGAKRAAGRESESLDVGSIEELRALLAGRPELTRVCSASSYLVDGEQAHEGTDLEDGVVVDVLPPFAGG